MLPQLADFYEVILVDGNSKDDTIEAAIESLPSVRIAQQTRKGKGNALAVGFAEVTGDIIVMFDVDGSADPAEIPAFVETLVNGADFAKGSRFREGGDSHDITPIRRLGNWGLNTMANVLLRERFTDLCYGYNAFWADQRYILDLPALHIDTDKPMVWGDGFEIETLINSRLALADVTIVEVPSVEHERIHGESNLHAVKDGIRVLKTLLHEKISARRVRRNAARRENQRSIGFAAAVA
jgi:glycosyltransferase involved in cell wall biosynthesis